MPHLICYDIAKNSLRAKMGKKIIEYGLDRINKSVYLGTIKESSLISLEQLLAQWMKKQSAPQDSLIIIHVQTQDIRTMRIYGHNGLDKEELMGEKSTLIV